MKKIVVKNYKEFGEQPEIPALVILGDDDMDAQDGYHTFDELYEHRFLLFIALMKSNPSISWRANNNDDGSSYEGWFVAGMHLPSGDISYHLPTRTWTELDGFGIATTNKAPDFDGHTSHDVLLRLKDFNPTEIKI